MIAYTGDFGSGKTAKMTRILFEKSKKKKTLIITNYTTTFSDFCVRDMEEFKELLLFIYFEKSSNSRSLSGVDIYIGIDEAQIWFSAREYKKFPRALLDFLCQLRKLQTEIYISVQRPFMLDKNFRTFVDFWRNFHRPLSRFDKKFYNDKGKFLYKGPTWINSISYHRDYELDTETTAFGDPLGAPSFHVSDKKIHEHYNSCEMVTTGTLADSTESQAWLDIINNKFHTKTA